MSAFLKPLHLDPVASSSSGPGLARLSLWQQFLDDPVTRVRYRAVDANWHYARLCGAVNNGYNPFRGEIYVAHNSALAEWLSDPGGDQRLYNEGDFLVFEALFAVHDYLHAWSTAWIQQNFPQLEYGYGTIDDRNFEDHCYALLATEAVATVGLDYWYLAQFDLDACVDLGTGLETLTSPYHRRHDEEYRRFASNLEIDTPRFLVDMGRFYCTGVFKGFDLAAVRRSPRVLYWMQKELGYGQLQRRYTRSWLRHLGGLAGDPSIEVLGAPLECETSWKIELLEGLSLALWRKVRHDEMQSQQYRVGPDETWRAPRGRPTDYRFTNLHRAPSQGREPGDMRSELHRVSQFALGRVLPDDPDDRRVISDALKQPDRQLAQWVLERLPPVDGARDEAPADLFVLQ